MIEATSICERRLNGYSIIGNTIEAEPLPPDSVTLSRVRAENTRRDGMGAKRKTEETAGEPLRLSKAQLDDLVEEALMDAYGESEQVSGFYTMLENDLQLPFETKILGVPVTVESIDITDDDQLVALCRKDKIKQRISLSELPLPSPPPKGTEWIVAYRYWRTGKIR